VPTPPPEGPTPERPTPGRLAPEAPASAPAPAVTPANGEASLLASATEPLAYGAFELPDGVRIDDAEMAAATELFRESGLAQEQAQKFIDLAVSRERAAAERSFKAFVDLQNQWVSEIKADPDIGGQKLQASLAAAARAIDRLAVPGLKDALNLTGAGNHPDVIRAFVRIGQLLSEDRFAPGRPPAPNARRSPADIIYDAVPKAASE
jgi:hypothetical protein